MSVGQTPNLGLLYAEGNDPVSNWPAINGINTDSLDSLFSSNGVQSYQPNLDHSTGSPNLGSTGQLIGRFYKLLDIYFFWIIIEVSGTGINMGTGTLRPTLPVDAASAYRRGNSGSTIGGGISLQSTGLNRQIITTKLSSAAENVVFMTTHKDSVNWTVTGDSPGAFTDGTRVELWGRYRAEVV